MTLATLQSPISYAPKLGSVPTGAVTTTLGSDFTFTLDAAGDKFALVFQSPGTTFPDGVKFEISAVSAAGTAGDIEATIQTLATDGTPSGTLVTNSATGTSTISTPGIKSITGMIGTATIARGDHVAVVLTCGAGWDRTMTLKYTTGSNGNSGMPYVLTKDTAGAWAKVAANNYGWCVGLFDSGGTAILVDGAAGPYDLASFITFAASTNPDERGNRFTLPVPATCIGVDVMYTGGSAPGANDGFTVRLVSSHTTSRSNLASMTVDGDAQTSGLAHRVLFTAAVDLAANTVYAISFEADGTDSANLLRWDYASNDDLACFMGASFYSTTADADGNFTDDPAKVYAVFPVLSKLDDGAGGGGGGGPLVGGRLVR